MLHQSLSPSSQDQRTYGIQNSVWRLLWKVKLPMKVLNFIWKILHDSLPFFEGLKSRGIKTTSICLMCNEEEESVNHLFL